jgi:tellurite methyltransferase
MIAAISFSEKWLMNSGEGWDWDRALRQMPGRWTGVAEEVHGFAGLLREHGCRSVYDLGCGVGRHTVFLAQLGFEVSASDISSSAIAHTGSSLREAGVEAQLQRLDMHQWPFADAAFDALVAYNVIYHAERAQIEAILAQVRRVLRPRGLLLATFKSTLDSQYGEGVELAPFTWAPSAGIEQGVPHYYVDDDEVRRLLADFELLSLVLKQEFPPDGVESRHRAHWVVRARRPG